VLNPLLSDLVDRFWVKAKRVKGRRKTREVEGDL
jgi:hypothetical protein